MFLLQFCAAFGVTLAESAPYVVLGFAIAGVLREFVSADMLRRGVGGDGLTPVLRAVGVGALLPVCSCSAIPIGIGLSRSGASSGTALAFMTSGPAVSPVTVVLGWSLLGPWLLGWYVFWALSGALLIGWVGNQCLSEAPQVDRKAAGCGCGCRKAPKSSGRLANAVRWAFKDLGAEVSLSLFVGLAVASLVLVALPSEVVSRWLSQPSWAALLVAIAVSLPAYTCSVPSLVIAGSLIARGVDPSVAVAFLVAGPATNLGEINAIRSAMGGRAATFYTTVLITVAFAAGSVTSWAPIGVIEGIGEHVGHRHGHAIDTPFMADAPTLSLADVALWRWPFVACVVALAVWGARRSVVARLKASRGVAQESGSEAAPVVAALRGGN